MEVKINKEIREFSEAVFFGMSLRQCIFAVLACGAAVGIYFLLTPYMEISTLSWVCIVGAAPFAVLGFIKWHGMNAEEFCWAWIKSEVLTPKRLLSEPSNLYFEAVSNPMKQKKKRAPSKASKAKAEETKAEVVQPSKAVATAPRASIEALEKPVSGDTPQKVPHKAKHAKHARRPDIQPSSLLEVRRSYEDPR